MIDDMQLSAVLSLLGLIGTGYSTIRAINGIATRVPDSSDWNARILGFSVAALVAAGVLSLRHYF